MSGPCIADESDPRMRAVAASSYTFLTIPSICVFRQYQIRGFCLALHHLQNEHHFKHWHCSRELQRTHTTERLIADHRLGRRCPQGQEEKATRRRDPWDLGVLGSVVPMSRQSFAVDKPEPLVDWFCSGDRGAGSASTFPVISSKQLQDTSLAPIRQSSIFSKTNAFSSSPLWHSAVAVPLVRHS